MEIVDIDIPTGMGTGGGIPSVEGGGEVARGGGEAQGLDIESVARAVEREVEMERAVEGAQSGDEGGDVGKGDGGGLHACGIGEGAHVDLAVAALAITGGEIVDAQ